MNYLVNMTGSDGELKPIVTPIVVDDYAVAMLSPIVTTPNAANNFLATFSYKTWLLMLAATLFVSSAAFRNNKRNSFFNFDLCFHFLTQGMKSLCE